MYTNTLSIEDKLLLSIIDLNKEDETFQLIVKHKKNINWNYFSDNANQNGIAPLLYKNIKKTKYAFQIPAEIQNGLKKAYYTTLANNIRNFQNLNILLKALNKANIEVIALKGSALSEVIYNDLGLRPMGDIDLLVKSTKIKKAWEILINKGYRTSFSHQSKLHHNINKHLPIVHSQDKNTCIEIHKDIASLDCKYRVDIGAFWENACNHTIANNEIFILSPENFLQHLCLHLEEHFNEGIRFGWLYDIAELIKHYKQKINWELFIKDCKKYKTEKPIRYCLYMAKTYLNAPVPEFVISDLEIANSVPPNKTNISVYINKSKEQKVKSFDYIEKINSVNGLKKKAIYLFADIFPSKQFLIYRYSIRNKYLIFFYYILRFVVAIYRGCRIMLQIPLRLISKIQKK